MQIVAHSEDGRYIVARSDSPKADAVVVGGRGPSPVLPAGSLVAMSDWLPGPGEVTPEERRRILETAGKALG